MVPVVFACVLWTLLCTIQPVSAQERFTVSIDASEALCVNPVALRAVADTADLLRKAFPRALIGHNLDSSQVRITLPVVAPNRDQCLPGPSERPYFCTAVPDSSYHWNAGRSGSARVLQLEAGSPEGVSAGLYGLLQEKMGFRFHHPRESLIPSYDHWPLPPSFSFSGTPRFEKQGFHLHTLHPIELTEQLHDPGVPRAFEDVKEYIDWLARNGQNTFQFFLLRGVDREAWPPHARRIVEYAHSRGIRCGVEISLSMIQQQAFQAITLLRPYPSYQKQVDRTLEWLFQAPWDYLGLDVTMGEHLPFLDRMLPDVQMHIEQQVSKRFGARLLYATHVIASDQGEKVRRPKLRDSGIMIHTVMCYSATEQNAPVYGNRNQRFMHDAAVEENRRRETWYWPESSYWVGFDSSVPLLLLPYLDARWNDIRTMAGHGLSGHLTFTSGWEWGYWLVDWSIARWGWSLKDNGRERPTGPNSRVTDLFGDREVVRFMDQALQLQNRYLKDRELLRYITALTPFSELPPPFDKPFQPEPDFSYGWLYELASNDAANSSLAQPVVDLEAYARQMTTLVDGMSRRLLQVSLERENGALKANLLRELCLALRVTALRAEHRALTLKALLARKSRKDAWTIHGTPAHSLITRARLVRGEAAELVKRQEHGYRYPPDNLARKRSSLTAYQFGYLYPVSNLFFWEREEKQVEQARFDALFMKLWDVRRTVGVGSLFF